METKTRVPKIERNWQIKDRTYVLTGGKAPLSWTIQSKHTARKPLLWFDEETNEQRELRYASNQKSLFVDEQKGNATLAHVVFLDGILEVPQHPRNISDVHEILNMTTNSKIPLPLT